MWFLLDVGEHIVEDLKQLLPGKTVKGDQVEHLLKSPLKAGDGDNCCLGGLETTPLNWLKFKLVMVMVLVLLIVMMDMILVLLMDL